MPFTLVVFYPSASPSSFALKVSKSSPATRSFSSSVKFRDMIHQVIHRNGGIFQDFPQFLQPVDQGQRSHRQFVELLHQKLRPVTLPFPLVIHSLSPLKRIMRSSHGDLPPGCLPPAVQLPSHRLRTLRKSVCCWTTAFSHRTFGILGGK